MTRERESFICYMHKEISLGKAFYMSIANLS